MCVFLGEIVSLALGEFTVLETEKIVDSNEKCEAGSIAFELAIVPDDKPEEVDFLLQVYIIE